MRERVSAHAVANNNIGTMIRIEFVHFGQLLPQAKRGIENGCSGRIAKDPELVVFPYLGSACRPLIVSTQVNGLDTRP